MEKSYGGQGIAGRLVAKLVEEARKNDIKIIPLCSFAKREFKLKKEYLDVLLKEEAVMGIIKSLENRRTYYNIDKNLPVLEKEIEEKIKEVTELVPDGRWMVHPMARWCSPPTRAPDAAGWAENLKARQARAFTARCCCARKCPPPMPRPLPSAQLWRSAVP